MVKHLLVAVALFGAATATAQQVNQPPNEWIYGADIGVGRSDNINLDSTNKISQNMATADLDFTLAQQGSRLEDNLKGNFSYFDFLEHAYGNQLIGRFDGTASYAIIPERFLWTIQDNFGQGQVDAFGAPTPNNIQNINYLSTGPDLKFRFGGTTFLDLMGRVARGQYASSPFDSNRVLGGGELGMQLSARSTFGINVNSERVLFTNTVLNNDYDRSSGYFSYDLNGARTKVTGRLGATRVTEGSFATTGPLASLLISRKVSPASAVTVSGGRDLTDSTASFADLQGGAINSINLAQAAVTSSIYTVTYAQMGWNYRRDRTSFALSARWEKDNYPNQPISLGNVINQGGIQSVIDPASLGFSRKGGEFSAERELSRDWSARIMGSLYSDDYAHANFAVTAGGTTYLDEAIGAAINFRKGRAFLVSLRFDHVARVVSGVGSGTGYRENVVFLTIGYRPRVADSADH